MGNKHVKGLFCVCVSLNKGHWFRILYYTYNTQGEKFGAQRKFEGVRSSRGWTHIYIFRFLNGIYPIDGLFWWLLLCLWIKSYLWRLVWEKKRSRGVVEYQKKVPTSNKTCTRGGASLPKTRLRVFDGCCGNNTSWLHLWVDWVCSSGEIEVGGNKIK